MIKGSIFRSLSRYLVYLKKVFPNTSSSNLYIVVSDSFIYCLAMPSMAIKNNTILSIYMTAPITTFLKKNKTISLSNQEIHLCKKTCSSAFDLNENNTIGMPLQVWTNTVSPKKELKQLTLYHLPNTFIISPNRMSFHGQRITQQQSIMYQPNTTKKQKHGYMKWHVTSLKHQSFRCQRITQQQSITYQPNNPKKQKKHEHMKWHVIWPKHQYRKIGNTNV